MKSSIRNDIMSFLFIAKATVYTKDEPGRDRNALISGVVVSFSGSFENINCVKLPNSISYYLFNNTRNICLLT